MFDSIQRFACGPVPRRRLFCHLLLGALLAGDSLWAMPAPSSTAALAEFARARAGDEAAIADSVRSFSALLQAQPTHPVWLAYAGAATAMQATTTWLPWKKLAFAEEGLALLDKALALLRGQASAVRSAPDLPVDLEVRLVAASTFLAVPGFMNRTERGTHLLSELLASPAMPAAPLAFRGDVWLLAASQAQRQQRPDEARRYLQQTIAAGAPQAALARTRLSGLAS